MHIVCKFCFEYAESRFSDGIIVRAATVFAPPQRGRMLTLLPVRKLSDTMATKRERNGAPLFVTIC